MKYKGKKVSKYRFQQLSKSRENRNHKESIPSILLHPKTIKILKETPTVDMN